MKSKQREVDMREGFVVEGETKRPHQSNFKYTFRKEVNERYTKVV